MSLKSYTIAGLFMLGLAVPGLSAAADAQAGEALSTSCAACHGSNGIARIQGYPNLAGQNEQYLVSSLKAYRGKQRRGGQALVMQGQATGLSDDDIVNLAAFYAGLPADGE